MAVNVDIVGQYLARFRKCIVECNFTSEQSINAPPLIELIHPHPGNKQQISLARLHQHAGRHAPLMHIPAIAGDFRLTPDGPGADFALRRVDPGDPVHQQQGRPRHTRLFRDVILRLETLTKKSRDAF